MLRLSGPLVVLFIKKLTGLPFRGLSSCCPRLEFPRKFCFVWFYYVLFCFFFRFFSLLLLQPSGFKVLQANVAFISLPKSLQTLARTQAQAAALRHDILLVGCSCSHLARNPPIKRWPSPLPLAWSSSQILTPASTQTQGTVVD